jgi:hypothetical protein
MKSLIAIILSLLALNVNAQAIFGLNAGYDKAGIAGLEAGYRIKHHSVFVQQYGTANNRTSLPLMKASVNYGYDVGSFQPFIGYGTEGLNYGLNKYFGNHKITVGKHGDYKYISVGYNTLELKDKLFTNNDAAIVALQVVSGFSNGMHEAIQAGHWGTGKFWDNKISWKNKYKDFDNGDTRAKYPGSKTVFVGFTDGYHLTNLISNTANIATFTIALNTREKLNFKTILKKVLISAAANRAAYYVSYNMIFK